MISQPFESRTWKEPLWVVFPEVTPEMYPRPASWNDYAHEWTAWYCSLSREERQAYEDYFPEPRAWEGFYRFVSNEPR